MGIATFVNALTVGELSDSDRCHHLLNTVYVYHDMLAPVTELAARHGLTLVPDEYFSAYLEGPDGTLILHLLTMSPADVSTALANAMIALRHDAEVFASSHRDLDRLEMDYEDYVEFVADTSAVRLVRAFWVQFDDAPFGQPIPARSQAAATLTTLISDRGLPLIEPEESIAILDLVIRDVDLVPVAEALD